MPTPPVVVVLHDGRFPPAEPFAPVADAAEVRHTEGAGLADALRGADVLFAYDFLSDAVPAAWHAADSLRWLHVAAAGVDKVMTPDVRDSDVTVTNSRGLYEGPIAEHVLTQILSFAKDVPGSLRLQRERTWRHRENERVAGTRALVVGTGPIGRAAVALLRAVGIEVAVSGRRGRVDPELGEVAGPEDLPAELARADWVVLLAPLTEQTRGMIDAAALAAMAPHARLINAGRGELVRTDDLVAALRSGAIAGAALDVVDPEPPPPDHPLWDLPGVVLTPHNSGDVHGWRESLAALFADNFRRWQAGEPLRNVVDKSLGYVPTPGSSA